MRIECGDSKRMLMDVTEGDLVLTDPPYIGWEGLVGSDKFTTADVKIYTNHFWRLVKETGSVVLYGGLYDKFWWHRELADAGFHLMGERVLTYEGGMKVKGRFLGSHEMAMWYVKDVNKCWFDEDIWLVKTVYETKRPRGMCRNWGHDYEYAPLEKMDVTPKPVGMLEEFVENLCPRGGMVIDPFVGSGATAEACVNLQRDFWGCDIRRICVDYSVGRVEKVGKVGRLDKWMRE